MDNSTKFNNEIFDNYLLSDASINDKKFVCDTCGRRYKYIRGLRSHQKLECGKEPKFECYICLRKFNLRGNLKTHIISVHKTIPHTL